MLEKKGHCQNIKEKSPQITRGKMRSFTRDEDEIDAMECEKSSIKFEHWSEKKGPEVFGGSHGAILVT